MTVTCDLETLQSLSRKLTCSGWFAFSATKNRNRAVDAEGEALGLRLGSLSKLGTLVVRRRDAVKTSCSTGFTECHWARYQPSPCHSFPSC